MDLSGTLLIAAALAAAAAGLPAGLLSGRVLGGKNAVIRDHPYMVSIEKLGHYHCGGAIVNSRYVLTTASCAQAPASDLTVRAASSLRGQTGTVLQVDKVVPHEKYAGPLANDSALPAYDLAVMRVSQDFDFQQDECKPAELFNDTEAAPAGARAGLTSWGDVGAGEPALQMQIVGLAVLEAAGCAAQLAAREAPGLAELGQLCAEGAEPGPAACFGDTGSPLTLAGRIAGLAAWGFNCSLPAGPAVFTDVGYFRKWIDEHAAY